MALSCDGAVLLDSVPLVSAAHLASRYEIFNLRVVWYKSRVLNALIGWIHGWRGFEITTLATIIMLSIHDVSKFY